MGAAAVSSEPGVSAEPAVVTMTGPADGAPVAGGRVAPRAVRVAVDIPALADQARSFDYLVPSRLEDEVEVGTMVRVVLHGRKVTGWVVEDGVTPPAGILLHPLSSVTGRGPAPDIVELSTWAAWRWAGRRTALLRTASPLRAVRRLPGRPASVHVGAGQIDATTVGHRAPARGDGEAARLASEALGAGEAVVRLPPAADPLDLVLEICAGGPVLVVTPSVEGARSLAGRMTRAGVAVALVPDGWARAAAGGVSVVGARAAAWAPAPDASAVIVLDAHDPALVEERAPSWSAWVVAAERARRRGVPCLLVSPCPTLEQLQWGQLTVPSRVVERQGWAALELLDRTHDDPRAGLLGERLVGTLRGATVGRRVVCVLNRKGRARLLACRSCGELTVCEHCRASMEVVGGDRAGGTGGPAVSNGPTTGVTGLRCRQCGRERPGVCQACGSAALKALRIGVTRVREELEALARLGAGEVTAEVADLPPTPLLIGTEAVLNRVAAPAAQGRLEVGAVIFVDFDAELLAPRHRAGEDALALLARAARVVGGRRAEGGRTAGSSVPGRVVVQTRQPHHPVLQAAIRADPGRFADAELAVRTALELPPATALAEVSGDPGRAAETAARLSARPGVDVFGPTDGRWLVRAANHRVLCDAFADAGRPGGAPGARLRIDIDPLRV